jgi:hypothetical protein
MNSPPERVPTRNYWFPAKRFGWGWGRPRTWQGWVVTTAYVAAMVAIGLRAPPQRGIGLFMLLVTLATAALILVCWLTGEPPAWRWGDREDGNPR